MKVLVTGATGSVGSHMVEQLLAKDIEVKALSRKESNLPKGAQVVLGDLDIPETIKAHLQTINSLFLITQSEQTDEKFIKNKRIIQMAKQANVARIVALIDFEGNPIEDFIKNSGMDFIKASGIYEKFTLQWLDRINPKRRTYSYSFPR
ncbi:NAD(P)H-binding protein [Paenibacillus sp. LX16]|uniref:SDR family oxidoreductase n=1 Tax=Paenibacillus sp. LX16 TaxID=1740264 RepID=UPI002E296E8A|nr:NAD(P)H-binding protein [Paenibacillus sp. LX16]